MGKAGMKTKMKMKRKSSTTVSSSMEEKKDEKPPAGAKILSQTIRTETEEIENGYMVSKNYDVRWEDKKGETHYAYYSKRWFSKEDPLTITVNDKGLADAFDEDEEGE